MIVNHFTGDSVGLRDVKRAYPRICAPGNPLIGTPGYRVRWADERSPTDAELRAVGHSLVVETIAPTPNSGERVRPGPLTLVNDIWQTTWIVEPIPPPPVPEYADRLAVRRELTARGFFVTVNTAVLALPPSSAERENWTGAALLYRDGGIVQVAAGAGVSATDLDDVWRAAGGARA